MGADEFEEWENSLTDAEIDELVDEFGSLIEAYEHLLSRAEEDAYEQYKNDER